MEYHKLNWFQMKEYVKKNPRIVFTTGAVEQHGCLSILTDHLIPYKIAQISTETEKILLAPPLQFGFSTCFNAYPGTISLSSITYLMVIKDLLKSFVNTGFKKKLF